MASKTTTLDGYIRVSRVNGRDGDSYLSPSMQEEAIKRTAQQAGVKLGQVVREEDVSGATPVDERGLGELVRRCEAGESDGIIVARHNRLGRSLLETATACKRLERCDARYIAALDGIDTQNPGSRMTLGILAVIAEDEYERRKEDWARVVGNRIAAGVYIAVQPPFGYQKGEDGGLVPDESTASIVRDLFQHRARGESLGRICDWLNAQGIQPPGRLRKDGTVTRTGREWAKSTVARILKNTAYLGTARQGDAVNVEAHEPLVTQAEFDGANLKRQPVERRTVKGAKDSMADRALLRGIAVCANCGHNLKVNNAGYDRKTRERLPFYHCSGRFQAGKCDHRANASGHLLDPYVEQLVLAAFQGDSPVAEAVQAQQELHDLARQREEAQSLLTAYVANLDIQAALSPEEFAEGVKARKDKLAMLDVAHNEARANASLISSVTSASLVDSWPTLTVPEKRRILRALLDRVTVRRCRHQREDIASRVQVILKGNVLLDGSALTVAADAPVPATVAAA